MKYVLSKLLSFYDLAKTILWKYYMNITFIFCSYIQYSINLLFTKNFCFIILCYVYLII
ncbi:hypothetical protein BCR32DRAFT_457 [Anaeromyces robustus]|uniref:Uncharacterized protein n=1 Tax=Anaeromyces robustus TaxID=1754192 RepID=A0A1Y1XR45_9FUNG|nr:hypothetical protein BCR32DRAFT_457 [Anaeromyces robustus]|eukprot:ORX88232.1 hypothetical protein BCR32DRAFT_457 [Anaeromyces robustus]